MAGNDAACAVATRKAKAARQAYDQCVQAQLADIPPDPPPLSGLDWDTPLPDGGGRAAYRGEPETLAEHADVLLFHLSTTDGWRIFAALGCLLLALFIARRRRKL